MVPRYKQVPDHWKGPLGPYRQAPPEQGGEWWLITPFTGDQPWLTQRGDIPEQETPPGFTDVFGLCPRSQDFHDAPQGDVAFRTALQKWRQDLQYFKQVGEPEWADPEKVQAASRLFGEWEMGEVKFYEGRYGWMTRFPQSPLVDFESPAITAIETPHLTVAQFQIRLAERGLAPKMRHPFVPPHIWQTDDLTSDVA